MMCRHWHEGIGGCGGQHPGAIIGLVLLMILVGLAVWGIVALAKRGRLTDGGNGAMAIARERYARGEMIKEEFDQIKKDLRQ
jgi:putative membrane protein